MHNETLQKTLKQALENLAQEMKEGRGQALLQVLEGMGKFHQYSARNVMLILMQHPGASLVAGIKRWNELGRRVKKGEKGIAILAPTYRKETTEDPETGLPQERRNLIGFHTRYVFDISQTEGDPIAFGSATPRGEELYRTLRAACPAVVKETPLPAGCFGKTDGKTIHLSSFLSADLKAETLIHEWAHTLLHFEGEQRDRATEELEAEATAYAVGKQLGLSMDESRDYILAYRGTVEKLEASLERIQQAAKKILLAVETPMEEAA